MPAINKISWWHVSIILKYVFVSSVVCLRIYVELRVNLAASHLFATCETTSNTLPSALIRDCLISPNRAYSVRINQTN